MKVVKCQGGLGNQLFCLAFAHSVASLSGETTAIDLASFGADRYGHGFALEALATRLGLPFTSRPVLASRGAAFLMRRFGLGMLVGEREAPADRHDLERLVRRGFYFSGYWQNEAYIAQPDTVREAVRAFIGERAGEAGSADLVVHVRTYKEEIRPERRGSPGPVFFASALDRLETELGAAQEILLVSDDTALALERLGALASRVRPVAGASPLADLALLVGARRLILSNSSFSWWGGWCSDARAIAYPAAAGLYHYPHPARRFTVIGAKD